MHQQTKAWEGVTKIDTSKPYGGSSAGNSAFDSAMNNAGSSQTAGSPNIKPDTDYTLKLSDNITINVDKINNEQDIKKLAYQIGDIITERNKRDWKKVR